MFGVKWRRQSDVTGQEQINILSRFTQTQEKRGKAKIKNLRKKIWLKKELKKVKNKKTKNDKK